MSNDSAEGSGANGCATGPTGGNPTSSVRAWTEKTWEKGSASATGAWSQLRSQLRYHLRTSHPGGGKMLTGAQGKRHAADTDQHKQPGSRASDGEVGVLRLPKYRAWSPPGSGERAELQKHQVPFSCTPDKCCGLHQGNILSTWTRWCRKAAEKQEDLLQGKGGRELRQQKPHQNCLRAGCRSRVRGGGEEGNPSHPAHAVRRQKYRAGRPSRRTKISPRGPGSDAFGWLPCKVSRAEAAWPVAAGRVGKDWRRDDTGRCGAPSPPGPQQQNVTGFGAFGELG